MGLALTALLHSFDQTKVREDVRTVRKNCGRCKFFKTVGSTGSLGECYRSPPTAVLDDGFPQIIRPRVHVSTDGCGEFIATSQTRVG